MCLRVLDVGFHAGLANGRQKIRQGDFLPLCDNFHTAVFQVPNKTRHLKAARKSFDRKAKPDALHGPAEENLHPLEITHKSSSVLRIPDVAFF